MGKKVSSLERFVSADFPALWKMSDKPGRRDGGRRVVLFGLHGLCMPLPTSLKEALEMMGLLSEKAIYPSDLQSV